jgi:hypothetical protein
MSFGNWPVEKQPESNNEETDRFLNYIIGEISLAKDKGEWKEEFIIEFWKKQLIRFYSFYCFAFASKSLVEKKEALDLLKQLSDETLTMAAVQLLITDKKGV